MKQTISNTWTKRVKCSISTSFCLTTFSWKTFFTIEVEDAHQWIVCIFRRPFFFTSSSSFRLGYKTFSAHKTFVNIWLNGKKKRIEAHRLCVCVCECWPMLRCIFKELKWMWQWISVLFHINIVFLCCCCFNFRIVYWRFFTFPPLEYVNIEIGICIFSLLYDGFPYWEKNCFPSVRLDFYNENRIAV